MPRHLYQLHNLSTNRCAIVHALSPLNTMFCTQSTAYCIAIFDSMSMAFSRTIEDEWVVSDGSHSRVCVGSGSRETNLYRSCCSSRLKQDGIRMASSIHILIDASRGVRYHIRLPCRRVSCSTGSLLRKGSWMLKRRTSVVGTQRPVDSEPRLFSLLSQRITTVLSPRYSVLQHARMMSLEYLFTVWTLVD